MICNVCDGSGWLFKFFKSVAEWWMCPACGGDGCRILYSPPKIGPGTRRKKKRLK